VRGGADDLALETREAGEDAIEAVIERGLALEHGDDLDQAEGRLLAEVDLALEERLERAVALRQVELAGLDVGEDLADLVEALVEALSERADPLDELEELGDARLDLLGSGGRADRRAGAPGRRGGRACASAGEPAAGRRG
jgi:hypothetical protein